MNTHFFGFAYNLFSQGASNLTKMIHMVLQRFTVNQDVHDQELTHKRLQYLESLHV